jgi:hypothetical protein
LKNQVGIEKKKINFLTKLIELIYDSSSKKLENKEIWEEKCFEKPNWF